MKILLLEPFFSGSHKQWAEGYQSFSKHEIKILSLKGRHWKWRMFGGAVSLANQFNATEFEPDLILASDMLDLTTFLSLCRQKTQHIPVAIYFHENQITYPWSPSDQDVSLQRNVQYGFINYTSALAADQVFFNSNFHLKSFIEALPSFLGQFPDAKGLDNINAIEQKSKVLPLGMDLKKFDKLVEKKYQEEAIILWNHRWEYDKNPNEFFETLFKLKAENIKFKLIATGESYKKTPAVFEEAKTKLKEQLLHFGFVEQAEKYVQLLHLSDILPVTSQQDFFGGSTVEAIYCNCYPLLPKRLAFPEHIPASLHHVHLYNSTNELYQKLKSAIQDITTIRKKQNFRNFAARYDWSILAPHYDQTFEALVKNHE